MTLEPYLLVDDVMTCWPATIRVFLDFKLGCIGCPIASFHSVDDACREHGIDADNFLAALRGAAASSAKRYVSPGVSSAMPNSLCGSRRTTR